MKKLLAVLLFAASSVLLAGRLGFLRGKRPLDLGVKGGKLTSPRFGFRNSVASQFETPKNLPVDLQKYYEIAPIKLNSEPRKAFEKFKAILKELPHTNVVTENESYIYLEFETTVMRYVDDVEFLLKEDESVIHLRSASRLGRKDYGKNRARIEAIRTQFQRIESTNLVDQN